MCKQPQHTYWNPQLPQPHNAITLIEEIIRRIALSIHQGTYTAGTIPPALVQAIATELMRGVTQGSNLGAAPVADSLVGTMRNNVYVFSGFKTHAQLQEFGALLFNVDGSPRPFSSFLQDVLAVHRTYNVTYLQAEYNHAVACSQMAGNWQHAVNNADVAPYLRYQTAEDDHVRPAHVALNQVTKLVTDPFWDTYYPPNGWNCRCDTVEEIDLPADALPPDYGIISNIPPMFKNNVGKTGVLFPDTHPYYQTADYQQSINIRTTAAELAKL